MPNTMKSVYTLLFASLLIGIASCDFEDGIRDIELTLETQPFDRIRLETSSDVKIFQSNHHRVVIRGRERDVNDVEVRVVNDRLTLEEHGFQDEDIVIEVYVPEISQLESIGSSFVYGESYFAQDRNMDIALAGSGDIDLAIETDDLDLELSGSGYVYLEGYVQALDASITGSGWIRSFSLDTDFADVRIEGSGSAEVNVANDLDVFISGSGDVYYHGHPSINVQITGSGELIDAN
jgi:hypothetical protein